MSTILRALKKAEQASMDRGSHSRDSSDTIGFASPAPPRDDEPGRQLQSKKMLWLVIGAGVGLVLAAAAVYVSRSPNTASLPGKTLAPVLTPALEKDDNGPSRAGGTKPPLPPKAIAFAKAEPGSHMPLPAGQNLVPPADAGRNHGLGPRPGPTALAQPKAPGPEPFAPVLSHQPFDLQTLPAPVAKKQLPVKRGEPKNAFEKRPPAGADRPGLKAAPAIQVLELENLTLQAISWSNTPSARVAVINDRVLGENDTIEGYKIVTIDKNDIILSSGSSEKFRLVFTPR